ncbi:MAG: NIL domain-containing protein [Nitrospirota bacterium]|nr:NIL domain-containing protein [Nitrospirota bacterium]
MDRHEVRLHLTFPAGAVTRPVLYEVVKEFDVAFNIRRADIQNGTGTMDLALTGTHKQIEDAIKAMTGMGVQVSPIERNVIE